MVARAHQRRGESLMASVSLSVKSRKTLGKPRSCTASPSTSPTASSWCWSGPRAAASRRCCACSRGWRTSAPAPSPSTARVVNDVDSKDRDIAMVFQSYALYPHMTVARQHGLFAASCARTTASSIEERVARAAKILNLEPYLERYPRELSGGQRQRVAMGRAIVRDPEGVPVRRAAVATSTPSCAWRCARRSRRCTSA